MHKIGSLKLRGELFLAPMADYTNAAFRMLCKEYGAALVYTELISAKALCMKSKKTEKMLFVSEKEKPVFLQLFGNNPSDFEKAINFVEKKYSENFAGYDLNAGCSVPKALKGKYGCTIMENPENVGHILAAMKKSTNKPVTIKMRLGLRKENFLDVAAEAEKAGVDAVCLHPRLGIDGFSGNAKWEKIFELKQNANVPIIGNGDIKVPIHALEIKEKTDCDFEMIGRAVIGNAFFFKQTNCALEKKKITERTTQEADSEAKKFLFYAKEFNLQPNDVRPYFIVWAKGFHGASELRNKFALSKSIAKIEEILENCSCAAPSERRDLKISFI